MFLRRSTTSQYNIRSFISFLVLFLLLIYKCHNVQGQSNKVSSKLDFDDTEDNRNSSMSNSPGVGQQQGRGSTDNSGGRGNERADTDSETSKSGGNAGKTGPKIHGVRVTVDTGDAKKSKESKESVEMTDTDKNRKRIGIHTDITFEITADGEDVLNATSSQRDEKEDASVPIFRGRGGHGHQSSSGGSSGHKSRKPYDPRTRWNPNFSSERRSGYDTSGHGGSGYYPHYPSYNVPVYTGSGDAGRSAGGSIYRPADGWNSYVPASTYWTTERPYSELYRPNTVTGNNSPNWKPCYCINSGNDYRRRRDSSQGSASSTNIFRPTSSVIQVIDTKVDNPFSRK